MKKHFLKIAKVGSEVEFYNKYPTERDFFNAHPEAKNMLAMGGTPEAYPQIATFDKAFSYGVPPGPQYLSHGGSAYPQAQTEQQFFIPIYTDVYNPYNKAMGGPNKKKKQQQAEDAAANNVYGKMTFGYPTDAYDEFAGISPEKARDMSGRFDPNSGIDTWSYGNQIYDPGAYANWVNKKLGRQAVMPLQKPFEGPYDVTGRTPNWRNLPDQMDISEPYVDSGINYSTLTPNNPKNYLYVEPELKMGGSNVEMYPNAKTTPHWGPTNVWFQEGGQEGAPQDGQDLDRLGTLNKTGAFVNNLKQTAAKANAKNAMMNAINTVGMAKYGKQLNTYAPGGYTVNPNQRITSNVTQQMSPTSSQFMGDVLPPTYSEQLRQNYNAWAGNSGGSGFYPGQYVRFAPGTYNSMAMGNMNNFLPSIYDWNNPNQFMYRETGTPNWKWKTDIAGMGKRRGVSNIGLGEAWGLYSGDPAAREEALKKLNPSRITETPVGLFKRRMRRDYYWDPATQSNSTFKDWGTGTASQNNPAQQATSAYGPYADGFRFGPEGTPAPSTPSPYGPYAGGYQFAPDGSSSQAQQSSAQGVPPMLQNNPAYNTPAQKPSVNIPGGTIPSSPQQSSGTRAPMLMPGQPGYNPYANTSNYGPLASGYVDPVSSAGPQAPMESDVNAPMLAPGQQGYDPTVRSTTTSQAPSNANSSDAATAQKKASMIRDAQRQSPSGAPYRTPVGPVAEPSSGMDYREPVNPYLSVMAGNAPVTMTAQPDPNAYLTGAPYRTPVGPMVGPDGYAYGGNTGYKFGGSYKQGDVVYMSDDEIAEFIKNGGQIEEME